MVAHFSRYAVALIRVGLQHGEKGGLGQHHLADHLHSLFPFFLFLQQLAFTADVPAVTLGRYILSKCRYGRTGDDLAADGALNGDLEHLAGNLLLELVTGNAGPVYRIVPVGQHGKGIHPFAVDQKIQLYQVGLAVIDQFVIEGTVPLGDGFEFVVKIVDHLRQGQFEDHLQAVVGEILVILVDAPALHAQLHHRAHVAVRDDDRRLDEGLQGLVDQGGVGVEGRVVDHQLTAVVHDQMVAHRRRRQDQREIVFAFQAFLDHFQVQQAQKTAAEPESQGGAAVLFIDQGGVVELELFHGHDQILIVVGGHRVDRGKNHRLGFLETRQRLGTGALMQGDRIAAAGVADRLDAGDHVAHLAGTQRLLGDAHDLEHADLFYLVGSVVGHEADPVPGADGALLDAEVHHGAAEGIVMGIENQRLQGSLGIAFRRRQGVDHRFHNILDAQPLLGRGQDGRFRIQSQILLDLGLDPLDIGRGQVDLVDDRDDFQVMFHGQVEVGQGLGLDALAGIDQQQGAFAGRQRTGDLVGEIHVTRRVDQVEVVGLAILGLVWQTNGLALDRDAALPFDIHAVQNLILEIAVANNFTRLDQPVRQGRLAVIDMGDNAEVSYVFHFIRCRAKKAPIIRLTLLFSVVIITSFAKNLY
ncbi:hypothetical protein DESC_40011 [Desulfosarcina cetonica]|nr:hypothetical protein DESC_40011 [Desulfosarcina cetonica]